MFLGPGGSLTILTLIVAHDRHAGRGLRAARRRAGRADRRRRSACSSALVVALPFVYVPAGLVLGEVGLVEAISRSFRLVVACGARWRSCSRCSAPPRRRSSIGIGIGIGARRPRPGRRWSGRGWQSFPLALVIPVTAVLSFALGTLVFAGRVVRRVAGGARVRVAHALHARAGGRAGGAGRRAAALGAVVHAGARGRGADRDSSRWSAGCSPLRRRRVSRCRARPGGPRRRCPGGGRARGGS